MIRRTTQNDQNISTSSCNSTNSGSPTPGSLERIRNAGKRFSWDRTRELRFAYGGKQIDFIALGMSESVDDVEVVRDVMFSSDHFLLVV